MLVAPLATRIIHVFGTRVCLHIGVFLETLSLVGASFCKQKYQIILAQGFCFGWGMGFLFVGSVGIVSQWFTKKRSLANSIAASGSGLGGLMYSLVTQRVIDKNGLPWAFRVLAICVFTVNLTASNLIRDRNQQTGSRHRSFDFSLLRRPEFLLLQAWSFFSMLGYTILLFSLPAYGRSIGLSPQQSSTLGAILNLGQMLGRPFIGLSSDRWGRMNLATILTLVCAVFCFTLWIPSELVSGPMGILCVFAIVGGATAGVYWATIAAVAAEILGLQDLPSGLSWTWLLIVPPTTVAEAIALELRRKNAVHWIYLPPQIYTACMYIAGAVCIWIARGWKVGDLEWQDRQTQEAEQRRQQEAVILDEKQAQLDEEGSIEHPTHQDEEELRRFKRREIWGWQNLLKNMMKRKVV
jgi:MFS family permease